MNTSDHSVHGRLPVWLKGMTSASLGFSAGVIFYALPIALAAQHTPESVIASATAIAASPGFFIFLAGPILDVRFSRRSYALALTIVAAILFAVAILNIHRIAVMEIAATGGMAAVNLAFNALLGWLSTVSRKKDENRLSAWITVGNLGAGGLMSIVGGEMARGLPLPAAALLIAGAILAPLILFLWIPAPGPDRRLARDSFHQFWAEVFALVRRREVLVGLALFIAPCGTFSLGNMLGGLGDDFHASARFVGIVGGVGVTIAGIAGSLLLPGLAKRLPLRPLYLSIGIAGSMVTLVLILLPRTAVTFAAAFALEQVFQAVAIACSVAICFETTGQNNPLAATSFSLLNSAYSVPLSYMLVVDGWGYKRKGVTGAFAVDAGAGILACILLGLLLAVIGRTEQRGLAVPAPVID
jgi:MFS transporter, PAT family, beta-lactamase induction signal transducer AmpG